MDNKKWLGLLAITSASSFVLGYKMAGISPEAATAPQLKPQAVETDSPQASPSIAPPAAIQQQPIQKASAIAAKPETYKQDLPQPAKNNPQPIFVPNSRPDNRTSSISDDEIDKIVPAPFNQIAKGKQGDLREGLRKFADTADPNTSDANLANKMTDFILSHPRAQSIHLDSVICKADLCEIRLFEIKNGTWSVIFSEMALQDWWGGLSKSEVVNFPTQFNNQPVTGTYVLFQRLPQIATTTKTPD